MYVCQQVLEQHAFSLNGITVSNALLDRRPALAMAPLVHTEYVDNFVVLSQKRLHVEKAVQAMQESLLKAG